MMQSKVYYALMLGLLFVAAVHVCRAGKTTTFVRHTETTDPQLDGFWADKTTWKARWVKYWRTKTIQVPLWKKVWTPTMHKEWVPLPNAPSVWDNESEQLNHDYKAQRKD